MGPYRALVCSVMLRIVWPFRPIIAPMTSLGTSILDNAAHLLCHVTVYDQDYAYNCRKRAHLFDTEFRDIANPKHAKLVGIEIVEIVRDVIVLRCYCPNIVRTPINILATTASKVMTLLVIAREKYVLLSLLL